MADIYRSGPIEAAERTGTLATLTNLAGAAMSLALIVGIGVWGTKLVLRDVSGVPVVRAAEGPMRVQPDNPGGRPADHQGLAVNDVAGQGMAPPPPDELRLAPRPVALTDEDVPLGALAERAALRRARLAPAPTLSEEAAAAPATGFATLAEEPAENAAPPSPLAPEAVSETALDHAYETAALATDEVETDPPLSAAQLIESEAEKAAIDATIALALGAEGGIARSLRPKVRPSGLRTASLGVVPAASLPGPREIAPTEIPSGARLVQLGAFDSAETARAEWAALEARFGDYLTGKARVVQKASSGGKTFYRLRAHGFADLSDARRFCAALVAENADCIPVVTR